MFKRKINQIEKTANLLKEEIDGLCVEDFSFTSKREICSIDCELIHSKKEMQLDGSFIYFISLPYQFNLSFIAMKNDNMSMYCKYSFEQGSKFLKSISDCSKIKAEVFYLTVELIDSQKSYILAELFEKFSRLTQTNCAYYCIDTLIKQVFERCNVANLVNDKSAYTSNEYKDAVGTIKNAVLKQIEDTLNRIS